MHPSLPLIPNWCIFVPSCRFRTCCFNFGCNVVKLGFSRAPRQCKRSCGPMDKASDYESGDCRFESCQDQTFFLQRYLEIWDTTVEAVIAQNALIFLSSTLSANPAQTQMLKQEGWPLWVHLNLKESVLPNFTPDSFFILNAWKVFNNNHIDTQKESTVTGLEPAIPRSEVWCLIH